MANRERKPLLQLHTNNLRIGIVKSCFNSDITRKQLEEAKQCLDEYHLQYDVVEVHGCFEIVYALQQLAQSKKYDGLVALGCLIKGETIHFEVLAKAVSQGIMDLIVKHDLPIGFGIITAMNKQQAQARTWFGYDATYAVLDSLSTVK